jgi:hypothetical protein
LKQEENGDEFFKLWRKSVNRRKLIAGALLLPFAYCGYRIRPSSFRVKMTVAVDTPEGEKTGASVFEISASDNIIKLPFNAISTSFKGEAVAVDLPSGQTLFALLRTPKDNSDPTTTILRLLASPENRRAESWLPAIRELSEVKALGRKAILPRDDYPMLVRFADKNDPKTVEFVDPNDLVKNFGMGVKIKEIRRDITKSDVTPHISGKFSWWSNINNSQIDGDRYHNSNSIANELNRMDFKKGFESWIALC